MDAPVPVLQYLLRHIRLSVVGACASEAHCLKTHVMFSRRRRLEQQRRTGCLDHLSKQVNVQIIY